MGTDLGSIVAYLKLDMTNWRTNLNKAYDDGVKMQESFRGISNKLGMMANVGKTLTYAVSVPLAGMGTAALKAGMDFEQSMANVQALSGATGEELKKLEEAARSMAKGTVYSSKDAADAMGYMALAGWETGEIMEGLPSILNLAAAAEMDLGKASDIVTDYLTAFGKGADYAENMVDALAYTQANSNTTVEQLANAFKNCAVNANAFGMDIEQTSAILGKFADTGLKGGEAGTALNAMFRDMTTKAKNGRIEIGKTSVAIQDSSGNFRKMTDIIRDVNKATEGMGSAQKQAALMSTFTADSIRGMNAALEATPDEIDKLEKDMRTAYAPAAEQAKIKSETLKGALMKLKNMMKEVGIEFTEFAEKYIRPVIDKLAELAYKFTQLPDPIQNAVFFFMTFAAVVFPLVWLLASFGKAVLDVISFFKMFKSLSWVVGFFTKVGGAIKWVFGILMAHPFVAVTAALVASFMYAWNNIDGFKENCINAWNAIKDGVKGFVEYMGNIEENLRAWFDKADQWLNGLYDDFVFWLSNIIGEFGEWSWNLIANATTFAVDFVLAIVLGIASLPVAFLKLLAELGVIVEEWKHILAVKARGLAAQFVLNMVRKLKELPFGIGNIFEGVYNKVEEWANPIINEGKKTASQLADEMKNEAERTPKEMTTIGKQTSRGFADGISSGLEWIRSAARRAAQSALNAAKSMLGIHSPSRVFRDEVGRFISEGMAVGITKHRGAAISAIESLSADVVDAFNPDLTNSITMSTSTGIKKPKKTGLEQQLEMLNQTLNSGQFIDYNRMEKAFTVGAGNVDSTIYMDKTIVGTKTAPTVKTANDNVRDRLNRLKGVTV